MQYFDTSAPILYHGLAFSPDGHSLAVLARTGQYFIIEPASGALRESRLPPGKWPTSGIAYAGGGHSVAIAASGGSIFLLDPATGAPLAPPAASDVRALVGTADGSTFFMLRTDLTGTSEILRWDAKFRSLPSFGKHKGGWLNRVAVSPRGNWFAAGGRQHARVWNLGGTEPPGRATSHLKADGYIKSIALTADGSMLAVAVLKRVIVWDVKSGEEVLRYANHKRAVNALATHPERPVLVSGGNEGLVFVYDLGSRQKPKALDWQIGPITAIAFAPDGLRCSAAGDSGKVVVWDIDD